VRDTVIQFPCVSEASTRQLICDTIRFRTSALSLRSLFALPFLLPFRNRGFSRFCAYIGSLDRFTLGSTDRHDLCSSSFASANMRKPQWRPAIRLRSIECRNKFDSGVNVDCRSLSMPITDATVRGEILVKSGKFRVSRVSFYLQMKCMVQNWCSDFGAFLFFSATWSCQCLALLLTRRD